MVTWRWPVDEFAFKREECKIWARPTRNWAWAWIRKRVCTLCSHSDVRFLSISPLTNACSFTSPFKALRAFLACKFYHHRLFINFTHSQNTKQIKQKTKVKKQKYSIFSFPIIEYFSRIYCSFIRFLWSLNCFFFLLKITRYVFTKK